MTKGTMMGTKPKQIHVPWRYPGEPITETVARFLGGLMCRACWHIWKRYPATRVGRKAHDWLSSWIARG